MNKKSPPKVQESNPFSENSSEQENLSLEASLAELENLVHRLERGEDELDAAFLLYEQAEAIAHHAQKKLAAYENKLRIITQKGETLSHSTETDNEDEKPEEALEST